MKINWQTKKINDVFYVTDYVANGSFASLKKNVKYSKTPDYAILVRLTDFSKRWNGNKIYVSKLAYNFLKKSSLKPNDLVMSNVGEPGIIFLVPDLNIYMTLGPNAILIRPYDSYFISKFVFYYFLSFEGKRQIDSISTGAAQKKFNKTSFRELNITFPSLAEQHHIVKILDKVFGEIEKVKENTENNLKNSKELFESYLQNIFTHSEWEGKTLDEIANIEYGFTDKAKAAGEFRYIRITDIDSYGNLIPINKMYVKNSKEAEKFLLKDDDLLMARTGATFGKVLLYKNIEKSIFASYLIRVIFNKKIVNKLYWYFSKSKFYWDQAIKLSSGSAQPQFNGGVLKQLVFRYPKSYIEQKSIIKKLDLLSEKTKRLEEIYKQKLADLEELKKSMLAKAFRGEL